METLAGVPTITCDALMEDYGETGDWESYEAKEGYPCSAEDVALIRFFVLEWFYFGCSGLFARWSGEPQARQRMDSPL